MKRELIKFPTKVIIVIVILILGLFLTLIVLSELSPRATSVTHLTELKSVLITLPQNRGAIYISDSLYIPSSSILLHKPDGFNKWSSTGPIMDFDTIPNIQTLGDLAVPYYLSKEKDNDTIVANKDGDTLFFLLYKMNK